MQQTILTVVQIASAVILIGVVLLQQKGAGLGAAFGGSSNIYSTKRGIDKVLLYTTIIAAIIFFGISLVRLVA